VGKFRANTMISGAAIIRNGVKLGYPFIESIKSVLPFCGEFVVGVGDSDDGTRDKIAAINDPKIKIIDSKWDMSKRSGGLILSEQTNLVLRKCSGDWIFYIQSDEVADIMEAGAIRKAVSSCESRPDIEGIAFDYVHFYGSYYTVQAGRNWYKSEVRLIRNNMGILSYGDAQGFRRGGKKIKAVNCGAHIYHYGWARPPEIMVEKIKSFHKFWHDDKWIERNCSGKGTKDFYQDIGNLSEFRGAHPKIMESIINRNSEPFIKQCKTEYLKNRTFKQSIKDFSRALPINGHRNFILAKI
jgi:hypothetical protein